MADKKELTQEQKAWGAVGYIWILSLLALSARKDDEYIRFHANQGALLFVISIPLVFIPVVGWMINVVIGVLCIIGIIKALTGEKWPLPILSDTAVKFGDWVIKTIKL